MEHINRRLIRALWEARPEDLRSAPAHEATLLEFESEFGPIPEDFRWFLTECGGGVVGSEWVDDIERLATSHRKYERERGAGYRNSNMFVIGWDGGGQPFGLDPLNHAVVVEADGEIRQLSPSIEHFLPDRLHRFGVGLSTEFPSCPACTASAETVVQRATGLPTHLLAGGEKGD